jgi:hypothetical protein
MEAIAADGGTETGVESALLKRLDLVIVGGSVFAARLGDSQENHILVAGRQACEPAAAVGAVSRSKPNGSRVRCRKLHGDLFRDEKDPVRIAAHRALSAAGVWPPRRARWRPAAGQGRHRGSRDRPRPTGSAAALHRGGSQREVVLGEDLDAGGDALAMTRLSYALNREANEGR